MKYEYPIEAKSFDEAIQKAYDDVEEIVYEVIKRNDSGFYLELVECKYSKRTRDVECNSKETYWIELDEFLDKDELIDVLKDLLRNEINKKEIK